MKKKIGFSPFQARQTLDALMEMILKDPELFEQLPGVTQEQREIYEQKRKMMPT